MDHVYTIGTRAWQTDPVEGWVTSELIEKIPDSKKTVFVFRLENGDTRNFEVSNADLQSKSISTILPPLMNPSMLEASDDLTNLSHLNEPAVLQAIRLRYAQKEIYTYSGVVLIATNPFARVDSLYVPEMVQIYAGKQRSSQAPHLFAIAEEAYADMLRDKRNQTIVVSGESGAGKTVSAKYIMRYFATRESPSQPSTPVKSIVASHHHPSSSTSSLRLPPVSSTEEQVLATNPIMEAFGNAKTTRNDNSSRFGKYIEILFDKSTHIIGAKIRTYLLERSRLVFQPFRERNYHIFYQLVAGATSDEREELGLKSVQDFHYLNQGASPCIDGVIDADDFEITRTSLTTIGIPHNRQREIFRILAALLHIGNINIAASRNDSVLASDEPSLILACNLLGINATEFAKWCTKKQLVTRSETIISNLTQQQAMVVRDSVAKFIYANLFDWLVAVINKSLATETVLSKVASFIGVLDIYGFEHFAKNSFEQFCINYANEKLQQEFNLHVFKLEQEEYVREKIDWTFIDFSDNQPCIDLIEGKMGILSFLDEESRLPMGSDDKFVAKLQDYYSADKHKFYKKPRFGQSAFTICHYALDVTYESEGFIEKNRDTVPDEHLEVLRNSSNPFLIEILAASTTAVCETNLAGDGTSETSPASVTPSVASRRRTVISGGLKKPTLGGIFKSSLIELMNTINSTDVHYIRCIKPNESKEAWKFEGPIVLSQLRACGVLETVRISCAGYPTRWTYEEFALRYYLLVHSQQWTMELRDLAKVILQKALESLTDETTDNSDKYQLGLTKIFFRAGMLAFLENLRTTRLSDAAILIQKNLRGYYYRQKFLKTRTFVVSIQTLARRRFARQRADKMRQVNAALCIQSHWRGKSSRLHFEQVRKWLTTTQSQCRGFLCRKRLQDERRDNAAKIIQRNWRLCSQLSAWRQYRRKVILIQSVWRGKSARQEYRGLREEARDLKLISYKLENKVVELTQALGTIKRENATLIGKVENYENQVKSWKSRHNTLEARSKELQAEANQAGIYAARLDQIEEEFKKLQENYEESRSEAKKLQEEEVKLRTALDAARIDLEDAKIRRLEGEIEQKSLREQVSELQSQVKELITKQQASPHNHTNSGDLHAVNAGSVASGAVGLGTGLINLVSNKRPKRRSADVDVMALDSYRMDEDFHPRPVSMVVGPGTGLNGLKNGTDGNLSEVGYSAQMENIERELERVLSDGDGINMEVSIGLIQNLKIPEPSGIPAPSYREVLFPAYLINIVTSEMWNNGFVKESEKFLANVMVSIQQEVLSRNGFEAINPGAFWLSNVHEILSFVYLAEDWYEKQKEDNFEYDRLLELIKHDLESLEFNIYHTWMKGLKKHLQKMIVPAVIECQSLPGFVTSDSHRFLGKFLPSANQPAYTMDDLLKLLNMVHKAMKTYFLEESTIGQAITELLKLIGVTAFNDLLVRRNFLSWKRGLQINYNITRIEEWCKSHQLPEGSLQLEHLMQATKLLQLKKATRNDIEIIQDICWLLSASQIQRLLNQYLVADYEQPIDAEIMKAVASHVSESTDVLLLPVVDVEDSGPLAIAEPRQITALDTYIPSWLQTPRLKRLTEIVSQQALGQQLRAS